jgi:mannose-6-phosphate isomerase-like protein (cupin superfamily)
MERDIRRPIAELPHVIAAPLRGRTLGAADAAFVVAEWADAGSGGGGNGDDASGSSGSERPIAPLHVHHEDDEAWYVLEGRLGFRLGEHVVEASAGSAVFGPRGVPHAYWNAGPGPARYLIVMTPNTQRLIEALHTPSGDRDAIRALFERHGCILLA